MNKQAILHIPDSKYCFPTDNKKLVLRLRVDKQDLIDRIDVIYESKYLIQTQQKRTGMERKYEDELYAYYEVKLELSDVRLAYVFGITIDKTEYYFSEDGITGDYDFKLAYYNFFQLPYINEADIHREVKWMREAVFYEIFIDRFYRGIENKDDSYINLKCGEKPYARSFAGGDIPGITKKLDYLKQLGINALYLTPVFCSESNHKYDISDYHMIDERFGTNNDFDRLVKKAHSMGIRVVLDAVFNHCSENLMQFQDVVKRGRKSPYFDWFIIDGEEVDKEKPNYEVFAFCNYMPKLNTSNPQVQDFLINIAVSWIKKYDIDGWRLDVSDEISHDFWRLFRKKVKEIKSECIIIGENWHDANSFLLGDQYDGIMNYAFTKACLDYYAFGKLDAKGFAQKLNNLLMRNTVQVNNMMLNLLDSHDTDRFYTSVGCDKGRLLSAIAVMCMYVGAPCIYYGTEILLEGGYDPDNRRCFDWDEGHWDMLFKEKVRELLRLRNDVTVQNGDIEIKSEQEMIYIRRYINGEELTLVANQSGKTAELVTQGTVLTENKYSSGLLETEGFVIYRSGAFAS